MVWSPLVQRVAREGGGERWVVGHVLVDEFLEFAASRARPNTVRAYAHDLKAFFTVVMKEPVAVRPADVLAVITRRSANRGRRRRRWCGSRMAAPACRRRRSAAGWPRCPRYTGYLVTRGDAGVETNPVPRGLPTRSGCSCFYDPESRR